MKAGARLRCRVQVPVEFCQSAQPGVAILGFRGLGVEG